MQVLSTNLRVKAMGQSLATAGDQFLIAGCTNSASPNSPCTQVSWMVTATRVKIGGQLAILDSGAGLCSGSPGGPVQVQLAQTRVKGM